MDSQSDVAEALPGSISTGAPAGKGFDTSRTSAGAPRGPGRLRALLPFSGRVAPLRTQLIALTGGLVVLLIWVLAAVSIGVLENRFQRVLSDQQFATARYIAAELDQKLVERTKGLAQAAANLPAERLGDAAWLETYLSRLPALHLAFTGGMAVIGLDGRTISDYPVAPGRRGTYFGDRDYFRAVVATGRPYIDSPIMGRALKRPVLTISAPVFDAQGNLRAVMTGITDLTAPNLLGMIADRSLTGDNEFFVFALKDGLIVAATDARRAMTAIPSRGRNLMLDRFLDGLEGSGISTSSQGIRKLYSAKRVPSANWLVMAALPTEVAFGPIRAMQAYLYGAALVLTALAILAIRWIVGRVLAPLEEAGNTIRRMTGGQAPLAPLSLTRGEDEVGRLIRDFNLLVEDRRQYEAALGESEQRFRTLVENAPDAIFVEVGGKFAYVNAAGLAMLGAAAAKEVLGQPIIEWVHKDDRAIVAEGIRRVHEEQTCARPEDHRYLRCDGVPVEVEVCAVPFRFGEQAAALVFARDIGERRQLERERGEHAGRMEALSRRLVSVQEQERRNLARELHDRTSPNLAAIRINVAGLARRAPDGASSRLEAALEDILALVEDTSASVREICADLRPALLDYAGLRPALESYAAEFSRRTGIQIRVGGSLSARLAAETESALFRITQEALTNCLKHAQATAVDIELSRGGADAVLTIADDGIGFDAAALGHDGQVPGLGLLSMRERAEFAGGRLEITSKPGGGTRIRVEV